MKKIITRLTALILVSFIAASSISSVQPTYATSVHPADEVTDAIARGVFWLAAVHNRPDGLFWRLMIEEYGEKYADHISPSLDGGWGIAFENITVDGEDELTQVPVPHSSAMDTSMAIIGFSFAVQYNSTYFYPLVIGYIEAATDWLAASQNDGGYWEWEYVVAAPEWEGLPNLPSTYMAVMGLIFAGMVTPPSGDQLDSISLGLTWLVATQNRTDGGWGFLPSYLQNILPPELTFLVESENLITGITTSTLCLALQFGLRYEIPSILRISNTLEEAIMPGIDYVLETQEKRGGRKIRGSWYSQLMEIQGLDPRPFATTQSVICLTRFKTLFQEHKTDEVEKSIKYGIKWIGKNNLRKLDESKPTRDVVDSLIAFESVAQAGMRIRPQYKKKLGRAVKWVLDAQGASDDIDDPLEWGWGPAIGLPDTIYDTGFAVAALAWSSWLR